MPYKDICCTLFKYTFTESVAVFHRFCWLKKKKTAELIRTSLCIARGLLL